MHPSHAQRLQPLTKAGYALFQFPRGSCGCGCFSPTKPETPRPDAEALVRKYVAKGWKESKARRAAEQVVAQTDTSRVPGSLTDGAWPVIADVIRHAGSCVLVTEWTEKDKQFPAQGLIECTCADLQEDRVDMLEGRGYVMRA
jgi:hypothetical protein